MKIRGVDERQLHFHQGAVSSRCLDLLIARIEFTVHHAAERTDAALCFHVILGELKLVSITFEHLGIVTELFGDWVDQIPPGGKPQGLRQTSSDERNKLAVVSQMSQRLQVIGNGCHSCAFGGSAAAE